MLKRYFKICKLNKECGKFIGDWKYLMSSLEIQNKKLETYTLRNVIREEKDFNGIICKIQIPFGLLREDLLELRPYIEESLDCKFECDDNARNNCVYAKFKYID